MGEDPAVEILMVEDNEDDEMWTLRTFEQHKMANHVKVVRDGAEALEFLFDADAGGARARLKLVLLDLKLPKVDGIEVLRRIRSDPGMKRLPVVVLTSSHEERDLENAYALGVNSYVVKPIDFSRFTEVVGRLGLYWTITNEVPKAAGQ